MTSRLLILERQAQDQLPGGIYWEPSESLKQSTSNVPTTNVVRLCHFRYACQTMPVHLLWNRSQCGWTTPRSGWRVWIPKTKLLKEAREGATTAHVKFQLRKQQLLEQKKNKLLLKQTEKAAWRPLWLIRLTRPRKTFSSNNWNSKNMFWMPREIQLFFLSRKGRQLKTDELQTNLRHCEALLLNCNTPIDDAPISTLASTDDRKTSVFLWSTTWPKHLMMLGRREVRWTHPISFRYL